MMLALIARRSIIHLKVSWCCRVADRLRTAHTETIHQSFVSASISAKTTNQTDDDEAKPTVNCTWPSLIKDFGFPASVRPSTFWNFLVYNWGPKLWAKKNWVTSHIHGKEIRISGRPGQGFSWPSTSLKIWSWGQKLHVALMSDMCQSNGNDFSLMLKQQSARFQGCRGENQRIMLHDKTWFLSLTPCWKWFRYQKRAFLRFLKWRIKKS